jgi:hypothetical protein
MTPSVDHGFLHAGSQNRIITDMQSRMPNGKIYLRLVPWTGDYRLLEHR